MSIHVGKWKLQRDINHITDGMPMALKKKIVLATSHTFSSRREGVFGLYFTELETYSPCK